MNGREKQYKKRNIKPKIINLSTHKLNKDQINLIKRDLKFCTTPRSNIGELLKNLEEFERKFRLIEIFKNKKLQMTP